MLLWTYDLAREQSPTLDCLRKLCRFSLDAGYDGMGLYFEHRFAYPSASWAHGHGAVTPAMVRALEGEFPSLQIVPFVNLLGHFEGFLYTEFGKQYRELTFQGLQACPSNPAFVAFCRQLLDDVLAAFASPLVHIGGDETKHLGACPKCALRVERADGDGKAALFAEHFAPLIEHVLAKGRRPAIWGDMLASHPSILEQIPKETLIFDWQYFGGIAESSRPMREAGFVVVGCPALHTYNATWLHLNESEANVREVASDVRETGAAGVCVTTWENALFGAYDTLLPALAGAAEIAHVDVGQGAMLRAYLKAGERHEEWARLMGIELNEIGGCFGFSKIRSSLKVRFLLQANPFSAWLHHGDELAGPAGGQALQILERALAVAPTEAEMGVTLFARGVVEFVRMAEEARVFYAAGEPERAIGKLAATRPIFEQFERVAKHTHERIGGSLADIERARNGKRCVESVLQKIRHFGDGSLGYLPAFEHITHPKFVPHDQGAWWLINSWANE